jgi:hypothetical protein
MELDDDDANDADYAAAADDANSSSEEEAVEDEDARRVRLLAGVVRTNEDYGLGGGVVLPDADGAARATFGAVELWAPTFFASRSVVRAGGFTEADPLICFQCLCWNLTVPFSQCTCEGWTGCGQCSYIQHAR